MPGKSILTVDDSRLARLMIRGIFAELCPDWRLMEAANGDEALRRVADGLPDLALIDINMPGMSGLDLCVKLLERAPTLRITLVTANIQEKMRHRAAALGVGFMEKPVTREKVKTLLDRLGLT
ncbi:MAG: response regulator [Magnetococcales bacterium]|nr:response regulator [Magnetococcales bacterium]